MTSRKNSSISGADLTDVVNANMHLFLDIDESSTKKDSIYRVCDFIVPGKGFLDFMSRNSKRIINSDNCVRDSVYTALLGAWHVGYGIGLYSGISKLFE